MVHSTRSTIWQHYPARTIASRVMSFITLEKLPWYSGVRSHRVRRFVYGHLSKSYKAHAGHNQPKNPAVRRANTSASTSPLTMADQGRPNQIASGTVAVP